MSLVNELAYVCAAVQTKCAALDDNELRDIREQFDNLEAQEGSARAHAGRLEDLAKLRSAREDTTATGYGDTFAKRMVPIPHTLGEAGIRGAGTLAGGIGGSLYGKALETLDPHAAKAVVSPERGLRFAVGQGGSEVAPIIKALQNLGLSEEAAMSLGQKLSRSAPGDLAEALQETRLPFSKLSPAQQALRGEVSGALGAKGVSGLRTEVGNLIRQAQKDKGVTSSLLSALKSKKLWGGVAGVGAGALLTGLPFALRALYLKGKGGEGAYRARGKADQAVAEGDEAARRRSELLENLKNRRDPDGIE